MFGIDFMANYNSLHHQFWWPGTGQHPLLHIHPFFSSCLLPFLRILPLFLFIPSFLPTSIFLSISFFFSKSLHINLTIVITPAERNCRWQCLHFYRRGKWDIVMSDLSQIIGGGLGQAGTGLSISDSRSRVRLNNHDASQTAYGSYAFKVNLYWKSHLYFKEPWSSQVCICMRSLSLGQKVAVPKVCIPMPGNKLEQKDLGNCRFL